MSGQDLEIIYEVPNKGQFIAVRILPKMGEFITSTFRWEGKVLLESQGSNWALVSNDGTFPRDIFDRFITLS